SPVERVIGRKVDGLLHRDDRGGILSLKESRGAEVGPGGSRLFHLERPLKRRGRFGEVSDGMMAGAEVFQDQSIIRRILHSAIEAVDAIVVSSFGVVEAP